MTRGRKATGLADPVSRVADIAMPIRGGIAQPDPKEVYRMRIRSITTHVFGAVAEGALIALLVTSVVAGVALAGKPAATGPGSITVTPNPVALGTTYHVAGSGFKPDLAVNINLAQPYCCRAFTVIADSSGNWAFETGTNLAGTYKVDAYQRLNGRKLTLMGSTTFVVQ